MRAQVRYLSRKFAGRLRFMYVDVSAYPCEAAVKHLVRRPAAPRRRLSIKRSPGVFPEKARSS